MTHEIKDILNAHLRAAENGLKTVLATVVDLDGSSYRKPGVRMLIAENGQMTGAVSGGCVEKDIARNAESVFKDGEAVMMTYDGRYRLGCEGVLYILIEIFNPDKEFISAFHQCLEKRDHFKILSHYRKEEGAFSGLGSYIWMDENKFPVNRDNDISTSEQTDLKIFEREMPPCFKLMIFGAEHDAVQLCKYAALNGWEVSVIAGPLEAKTIENFPGASEFHSVAPDALILDKIDNQTAIVIMSHNFANDLRYLIELKETDPAYIGLLGPAHRREKLYAQFIEYYPEDAERLIDRIHGPAGLNIGAETPQEIAISILSEILSVVRDKKPILLKEKKGGIHA
ncbi:MAG: XdhC/CoxI family protein [Flavobacterium sp.]|nr:MAG: XdhC/CoxI family protein [Flavobacterium sp.]